ncbi:MAG: hypothetical protein OXC12_07840 [Spirochaetaceae bacterium]|nr:hypothetical protein [Spirochaetaceae bacterium]
MKLGSYLGRTPAPACINVLSTELHGAIDLAPMITVVSQRCVHLKRGQVELIRDLGATFPLMFVPDHDVLYRNPVSGDTWLPAGDSRCGLYEWMHRSLNPDRYNGGRLASSLSPAGADDPPTLHPAAIDLRLLDVQGDR